MANDWGAAGGDVIIFHGRFPAAGAAERGRRRFSEPAAAALRPPAPAPTTPPVTASRDRNGKKN